MEPLQTTLINYGSGIYGIDQQMVRAFLLVGTRSALLLDTGAVRTDISGIVREVTDLPIFVLLTHGDGDHIGNLQDFTEAYCNEADKAAVLSHEPCRNTVLHPLSEGQIFDLGGRKLEVLFTPGHTAGSVSLLDRENRLLFAGDTVSYGPVFMFGQRRDLPQYLHTLQDLQQKKNNGTFETVYCCHNTCPIPADTVDTLVACAGGILDHTILGVPAPMPLPTEEKPLLGKYGNCIILFRR